MTRLVCLQLYDERAVHSKVQAYLFHSSDVLYTWLMCVICVCEMFALCVVCISVYLTMGMVFIFTESIRKIVDKSSIKFIRGIKLDTKNGKSEDRILVSPVLSE